MIEKPGVFDITDADYHYDPCPQPSLSSSIIKILDRESPLHAWHAHPRLNPQFAPEHSKQFDIGAACHELMLRGDSARFSVINALDYRTKYAQELRDEAYAAGRIPILELQAARATKMEVAVRSRLLNWPEMVRVFAPGFGVPEQTLVWQETCWVRDEQMEFGNGTWCRCKLDWLPLEPIPSPHFFWDFKSTDGSAEPESWVRRCLFPLGFDLQAAFYLRGIRAVLGIEDAQFGFVVAEQNEPHAISVIGMPPAVIAEADKRIDRTIAIWARCLHENHWPAYPQTIWWPSETPPWLRAEQEARGIVEKIADAGVGI